MTPPGLAITTLLLCGLALASVLVFGALGFDIERDKAPLVEFACGLLSCGMAAWVRRRSTALLVLLLSLAATVLAGPVVGFMLVFGLATGLNALAALVGTWGEAGMEGVGSQSILLLSIAAITAFGFATQAWPIIQACHAWNRGTCEN